MSNQVWVVSKDVERKSSNTTKTKNDGQKVVEIKKKCVAYPKPLTDHPEVIKEMEKCNKPEDACNPAAMEKCAENQFKIADKIYSDKAAKLAVR